MATQSPQVVMRSGPIPGSTYFLVKEESIIGRDPGNDIPVPDPEISRRHARFIIRPEGYYVEDLGSTNGTFVNGARLTSPQLLKNGDLITLAEHTVMSFEIPSGIQQAQPPQSIPATMFDYDEVPPVIESKPMFTPVEAPQPSMPMAPVPQAPPAKRPMGWCSILLIIVLIALIIIALVLTFMPTSWWCFLSFDQLPGCPVN